MAIVGGYDSHETALKAYAKFAVVRSVVEFGAGEFSTHLFLNRQFYPDLTSLITFERDGAWADKVRSDDPRHTMFVMPEDDFLTSSKDLRADLVFLDCGNARNSLMPTAMIIAPVFAIHDRQPSDVRGSIDAKWIKGFNSHVQTVFVSNVVDLSTFKVPNEP